MTLDFRSGGWRRQREQPATYQLRNSLLQLVPVNNTSLQLCVSSFHDKCTQAYWIWLKIWLYLSDHRLNTVRHSVIKKILFYPLFIKRITTLCLQNEPSAAHSFSIDGRARVKSPSCIDFMLFFEHYRITFDEDNSAVSLAFFSNATRKEGDGSYRNQLFSWSKQFSNCWVTVVLYLTVSATHSF